MLTLKIVVTYVVILFVGLFLLDLIPTIRLATRWDLE